MDTKIKQKVNELKDEMLNSIIESVKIPSVMSDEKEGAPFGENIDKALKNVLSLCDKLGFKTTYKDGYYGYAEIGEGQELVGILGHLDVVPEGELSTWDYHPYEGTIVDGKLYGRGTQDDKGPTIAAIYATKALMDLGIKFNKRVRFIFGTDEENLWRDMQKYKENNEEIPCCGFTPDSKFPMINAEKGLLQVVLTCKEGSEVKLKAGNAFNSVPDKAIYSGKDIEKLKKELDNLGFEYVYENDKICVLGTSIHSQISDTGKNAISRLCIALNNIDIKSNAIDFISDIIGEDANANNIIKDCIDDVSGKLTVNVGKIELNNECQSIGLDIRIPVTYKKEDVVNPLVQIAKKYNLEYDEHDWLDSIYVSEDNFLIKTLRKVFEKETGLDSTPLSSGGATYARALDNCVAFGCILPGKAKTEHQANEHIVIEDLMKATEIYSLAIHELVK
ncbi:MAG: M20 family metallopeptidase [Peptostreptococcaceae bacterium]